MAATTLTQEQIAQISAAMARGEIDLDDGPAQSYPPRQPDLGAVVGDLERWLVHAARDLERWLIVHVDDHFRCSCAGLVPRSSDAVASSAGFTLIGTTGDEDPLTVTWDRPLVDGIVEGMLGYDFTSPVEFAPDPSRPLTSIDLRLLTRVAGGLAEALGAAWPLDDGRAFTVQAVAADQGTLASQTAAGPSMGARFDVSVLSRDLGAIEFSLPGWLPRVLRTRGNGHALVHARHDEMREALSSLSLDLDGEIVVGTVNLEDVLAMKAGDVLTLDQPARAVLTSGGIVCFEGAPGTMDGKWAIALSPEGGGGGDHDG